MRLAPAAALLLVLASGCENALTAPGVGGSVQTTEALAILPADADVVGMMDLAAARQSDALAAVTGGAGLEMLSPAGSAEFDAFVRQTGFDPGRDLDRVYLAAPAMGRDAGSGRAAFVGYGRFSRERVERFVATQTEHPVTTADVAGVTLYTTTDGDGRTAGVAFPNDRMVVAGDEATVRQMLTRIGTAGTVPTADVQDLLDRVAFPDGAWFVARHLDAGGQSPAGSAMRLAEGVAVSMDFGRDGVPVRAFVRTPQPADLADLVRGSVSAARVGAADEPAMMRALDDVSVATVADGVTVDAFLPTALLAEMHADGQR